MPRTTLSPEEEDFLRPALRAAARAREHAWVPYSHYNVGAAVKAKESDAIYGGANVENASYGAAICAERSAILSMIAQQGPGRLEYVIVMTESDPPAPPCAQCLQVMAEFADPDLTVYLADLSGVKQIYRFDELLPHPFTFSPDD